MTPAEDILVFYSVTKCYKGNSEQFLSISMQDWFYIIPCTLLNRLLGICTVWRLYIQQPQQPQPSRWPYPPQQPNFPQPPLPQPKMWTTVTTNFNLSVLPDAVAQWIENAHGHNHCNTEQPPLWPSWRLWLCWGLGPLWTLWPSSWMWLLWGGCSLCLGVLQVYVCCCC